MSAGAISSTSTAAMLAPVIDALGTPVTPLTDPHDPQLLSHLGVAFLLARDWPVVDWVLASSAEQLSLFVQEASRHRVCIKHRALLANL